MPVAELELRNREVVPVEQDSGQVVERRAFAAYRQDVQTPFTREDRHHTAGLSILDQRKVVGHLDAVTHRLATLPPGHRHGLQVLVSLPAIEMDDHVVQAVIP